MEDGSGGYFRPSLSHTPYPFESFLKPRLALARKLPSLSRSIPTITSAFPERRSQSGVFFSLESSAREGERLSEYEESFPAVGKQMQTHSLKGLYMHHNIIVS